MKEPSGSRFAHEEQRPSAVSGSLPELARKTYLTARSGLSDLLLGTFDAIDDSLFELANQARSNNDQNRYFETMREIRIKRRGIEKRFQEELYNLFLSPPRVRLTGAAVEDTSNSGDSLSLVEEDKLEEQVAIKGMINKANATFQSALVPLQARFTHLYPGAAEDHPVNPLAPEPLCQLFTDAAASLDIDIRERLILLKHFDRYVLSNLGVTLNEANRVLIAGGILPDFRFRGRNDAESYARGARIRRRKAAQDPEAFLEQIHDLLEKSRQQDGDTPTKSAGPQTGNNGVYGSGPATAQGGPTQSGTAGMGSGGATYHLDGAELYQLLSQLPQTPSQGDLASGTPQPLDLNKLIKTLLEEHKSEDGRQAALQTYDEDMINLVSMLFEFILEDYNLSPPIQVLISRLQIPILKVVIKDRSFFSRPNHPARKLLNGLARAGIGWSQSDERNRDRLYNRIHDIVQRILNEFDGDIELFAELNDEFDSFLEQENRKSRLVEQRTRESERGRIKSRKAQETVDRLLADRLASRNVPESVRDMLLHGWSRVLFLAYLRDPMEHRWEQSVKVVDDLLWCLNPQPQDAKRDLWVRVVPELIKTMRAELAEVSYNSQRLEAMIRDLKQALVDAFQHRYQVSANDVPEADQSSVSTDSKPETTDAATSDSEHPLATTNTAVERERAHEDAAMTEHLSIIDGLEIGQWVEFNLVNGSCFRCKLSAVINEAESFVFVNRMGLKVVEKSRRDLAHELRRGRLQILEQGALIDRALDAIVGTLSRKAG